MTKKFNPYEILDVPVDATDEEISRAAKKASQRTHPDKPGGSEEAFKEVKRAQRLLEDKTARRNYDRSGDASAYVDSRGEMLQEAVGLLLQIINKEPEGTDVFQAARNFLTQKIHGIHNAIAINNEKAKKLARTAKRIKKNSGENMVKVMLEMQVRKIENASEKASLEVKEIEALLEFFNGYSIEEESPFARYFSDHDIKMSIIEATQP